MTARDKPTAAEYRNRAADIRAIGRMAEATAAAAQTAFSDLGGVGDDFGDRVALRLREIAREASWTATQVDVFAAEAAEQERADVGRLDEIRHGAPVVVLVDRAGRTGEVA